MNASSHLLVVCIVIKEIIKRRHDKKVKTNDKNICTLDDVLSLNLNATAAMNLVVSWGGGGGGAKNGDQLNSATPAVS